MTTGLPISDVVNVTVNLAPLAAAYRNFGALMILGSSPVIDVGERQRYYQSLDGIAQDFGTTAPEYIAAAGFFAQSPQPAEVYVGRWAQTATPGLLRGATLSAAQRLLTNFTAISNGAFKIAIDGSAQTAVSGLNFSGALNLNGVASIIQAALPTGVKCTWNSVYNRFSIVSSTTGASSSVGYASAPASGTDVSALLGLTAASGASIPVPGVAPETLVTCVANMADQFSNWYGLTLAVALSPADADYLATAAFIEGAGESHVFGITITNPNVLDPTQTNDLASVLQSFKYKRTFTQYSSSSPYAVASLFGRAFTVDFNANNSTITLKFKQEPGVQAETLAVSQAQTLRSKNCNVFINYRNNTAIIKEGVMCNGYFFDEVHGTDWLQNRVQNDVFNLLYQSPTKIPQTDEGTHQIVTTVQMSCAAGVNNGLIAPGVWNVAGFGSVKQGDMLPAGFYVYAPLVATQSQADRETRVSVPIQVMVKLAGAVHKANVLITVNR